MADVIISDLPIIVSSTTDDYFIINDANTTTAIISQSNLFGSIENLQIVGFGDGTETAPSITFTSDPNVGIYKPAADSWAVSTNGVQRLVIDDGGRVGINQRTPSSWFNGSNNLVVGDPSLGDNGISIVSSSVEVGNISFADGTAGSETRRGLIRYDHSDDHMRFDTAAFEAMRIDEDQDVLIGVTYSTEGVRLSVEGGSIGSIDGTVTIPAYTFQNDTNTGVWRPTDDTWSVATDGAERLTVGPTGDVYLEADADTYFRHPDADVISITNNGQETVRFDASNNIQLSGAIPTIFTNNNELRFSVDADNDTDNSLIGFYTNGSRQVVIKNDKVGIGKNTPLVRLDVASPVNYVALFQATSDNSYIGFSNATATNAYENIIGFRGADFNINVNNVSSFVIAGDNNNVGINQSDPQEKLDVGGNIKLSGAGSDGPILSTPASNTIALTPGTIERIRVDESGAIGLSGANYGLDGQVLSSQGPGVAPAWISVDVGGIPDISTLDYLP
jgi:hypothetical protein